MSKFEFLKTFVMVTKNSEQNGYYKWIYNNSSLVDVSHTNDIEHLSGDVEKFLKRREIEFKGCYMNSLKVSMDLKCNYVEGYIDQNGFPLEHSWNEYNGKFFDLTFQILFNFNFSAVKHYKVLVLTPIEVMEYAADTGISGPYSFLHYNSKVIPKKNFLNLKNLNKLIKK